MRGYAVPELVSGEQVLFTQRAYIPVATTSLSAVGVLIVLTNFRLLFAPRRVVGLPVIGRSASRRRSANLSDIISVKPAGDGAIDLSTIFEGKFSIRILPPKGNSIWSVRHAGPCRDETVRRIREACEEAATSPARPGLAPGCACP